MVRPLAITCRVPAQGPSRLLRWWGRFLPSGHADRNETQAREAWMTEKLSHLTDADLATLRDAVTIITGLVEND